jgi:chloride channel protein, CIC family
MDWFRRTPDQIRKAIWGQLTQRGPGENVFLVLLPVVGVLVGLTCVGTAHLISFIQKVLWGSGTNLFTAASNNPWPARIIIPLLGGLVVGAIGWFLHVPTRGGGVTTIIQVLGLRGGVLSLRQSLPRDWAAIFTIASGGSLGREGAMAMLAAAVGSSLGRRFKLSTRQLRMLVCAAAAAALAAVYNAPIGGSLFALEILMGNFALEVLGPVVVASVISTLVFRSLMGNLPRFEVPRYEFVSGWELLFYLVLGLLAGLVAFLFVRGLFGSQDLFEKLPLPAWSKPALGLMLVGCIGVFYPHVFGNGFEVVNLTLREQLPVKLLLILLGAKMVASALSFGSGAAGGLFTPSLMVGALLGGVFGFGVHSLFPHVTADYGAYALVGMGGVLAGMTHAPLMAIMMVFEQTDSYQIVLPLMFVCVVSHFTVLRVLRAGSMEEESLRRRGVTLPRGPEGSVMQTLRVADVMHEDVSSVNHSAPFPLVVERFLKEPYNHLYVTDSTGKFIGAIRLHALKEMLHQSDALNSVIAHDLVDGTFPVVTPAQKLAETMDLFWEQNCERLPVVNNVTDRRLIGWMSKRDLIGVYSQEILRKRQLLSHFVVTEGDERRDVFVELPEGFEVRTIEVPPQLAGKTLAELAPRSKFGVHVLALKRRDPLTGREVVEMPNPQTRFEHDNRLVVIGTFEGIAQLIAALATDFPNRSS